MTRAKTVQELNPSYARIFINHKTRSVNFEYPEKDTAFRIALFLGMSIYTKILGVFAMISMPIFLIVAYSLGIFSSVEPIATVGIFSIGPIIFIIFLLFAGGFFMIGPPLLFAYIVSRNENLIKKLPEWNKKNFVLGQRGYYVFKKKKLNKRTQEIIFGNVFMEYKMQGEFKKYIKTLDIEELPCDYKSRTFSLKKMKMINVNEKQLELWRATFTFTRIPREGYMEVKFL